MSSGPYSTLGGIAADFVFEGRRLLITTSREMIGSQAVKLCNARLEYSFKVS